MVENEIEAPTSGNREEPSVFLADKFILKSLSVNLLRG